MRIKPLERDIQHAILHYCALNRIAAWRRNVGAIKTGSRYIRFASVGQSDIWGILPNGRHFECEVKRPGEKPTKAQLDWIKECQNSGAMAFWCDSLEEFDYRIRQVLKTSLTVSLVMKNR